MYNVLLVDDERIPRELFGILINESDKFELKASAKSARTAHIYLDKYPIDIVVMDVMMQDGPDGIEAAGRIKKGRPNLKIVAVTSMPEVSYLRRARESGIDSFWYKEFSTEGIISVMERTMNGESVYPDNTPQVMIGNALSSEFTDREIDVLRGVVNGKSNTEIADNLGIDITTVKTHIRNMLQKTGLKNRTAIAIAAGRSGFVV